MMPDVHTVPGPGTVTALSVAAAPEPMTALPVFSLPPIERTIELEAVVAPSRRAPVVTTFPSEVIVIWLFAPDNPTSRLLLVQTEPAPVTRTVLLLPPGLYPTYESALVSTPPPATVRRLWCPPKPAYSDPATVTVAWLVIVT